MNKLQKLIIQARANSERDPCKIADNESSAISRMNDFRKAIFITLSEYREKFLDELFPNPS